jgi:hypothetical protein
MESNNTDYFKLWKINTSGSTTLVKDIAPSSVAINRPMVVCNGKLYFILNNELWESDGTDAIMINQLWSNISDYNQIAYDGFVSFNNILYFNVKRYDSSTYHSLFVINPSISNDLTEVHSRFNKINFSNQHIGNDFFYTAEDDNNVYLYKHNITDGATLIKSNTK